MGAAGHLKELGQRLVERAGDHVLQTDMRSLTAALDDPLVINVLLDITKRCEISTVGELLSEPQVEGLAPPYGGLLWRQLERSLTLWAEGLRRRGPRHRGTAAAAGVPEPPLGEVADAVERWAAQQGVSKCLDHPLGRLLPWIRDREVATTLSSLNGGATIGQCLAGEGLGQELRAAPLLEQVRSAARAYLWYCAGRVQVQRERNRRWGRRLDQPILRSFSHLLRLALRRTLLLPGVDVPVVFAEAPMGLGKDPPEVVIRFRKSAEVLDDVVETRLDLSEIDQGRLEMTCSCSLGDSGGCAHRRVLIEWTLDALHDRSDAMHAELVEVVLQPGWVRLVRALRRAGEAPDEEAEGLRGELTWRIGGQGRDTIVQPAIRRRTKTGRWGRGRVVSVSQCLEESEELIDSDDQRVLALLSVAEQARWARKGRELRAVGLESLVGHPRVFSLEHPTRSMLVEAVRPVVTILSANDGYRLAVRFGERLVPVGKIGDYRLDDRHMVVVDEQQGRCSIATLSPRVVGLIGAIEKHRATLAPESHSALFAALTPLQPEIELSLPEELLGEVLVADDTLHLRLEPLASGGLEASLEVLPVEGSGAAWPPGAGPEMVLGQRGESRFCVRRDLEGEHRKALLLVARLGLDKARALGASRWILEVQELALDLVVRVRELEGELVAQWPEQTPGWWIGRVAPEHLAVRIRHGTDWFLVDGEVTVEGERITLEVLLAAARSGARYVQLDQGRFVRIETSLRERLRRADAVLFTHSRQGLALGEAFVERAAEFLVDLGSVTVDEHFTELHKRIAEARELDPVVPEGLQVQLCPYELEGFRWMARISHWASGGCLADDPGLDKTVQCLALLLMRSNRGPALVVTPSSVEDHWIQGLRRVAPSLRALRYRGKGRRALLRRLGPGDVVVTSHDLLTDDVELLESRRFATFIIDHARAVENAQSRRARAACRVRAPFRLALCESSLEQNLGGLWSVFHVVNPGLLGSYEHFATRFATPIERNGQQERRAELLRLIQPLRLRRLRSEVSAELPPRAEVILPVELCDEERRAYDGARQTTMALVAGLRDARDRKQRAVMLSSIRHLRQMACHPRLLNPDLLMSSSKLRLILGLVDQLVEQGQRMAIFSQFAAHLGLLREGLDFRRVPYTYLDSKVPAQRRGRFLDQWRRGGAPLLLVALRSVAGLELDGADLQIHLDPAWETDLSSRPRGRGPVGERPVTTVCLIAQKTIEESLLALAARKREPLSRLFEGAEGSRELSLQELRALIVGDESERSRARKAPPRASTQVEGAASKASPDEAKSARFSAPEFPPIADRLLANLEEERRKGLIRTDTTVAVYRRAVKRFARFVKSADSTLAEPLARNIDQWRELYLEALTSGAFEAPDSEPSIARTVLRRLGKEMAKDAKS